MGLFFLGRGKQDQKTTIECLGKTFLPEMAIFQWSKIAQTFAISFFAFLRPKGVLKVDCCKSIVVHV